MAFDPKQVNTAEENANSYADKVDLAFANAGVVTKEGTPMLINRLAGSPTWLLALAQGSVCSEWQERCRKAYYALDPANCEDEQVKNLAQLAGIVTQSNSTPYVVVTITNNNNFSMYITSTNCYAEDSAFGYRWYLGQGLNLAPSESATLNLYCSKDNISVPIDTAFTFKSTTLAFPDFTTVALTDSRIDVGALAVEDLRNTLQLGYQFFDVISQCEKAIQQLNGIAKCSIFFNPKTLEPITLPGGIVLPGRNAFIAIQGADVDQLIAQTYYKFMNVQSVETANTLTSTYQLGASILPVYYEQVVSQSCYIKVICQPNGSDTTYIKRIRDILINYSGTLPIGKNITAQLASTWLSNLEQYLTIYDVELSMDGTTYGNTTNVQANKYLVFDEQHIVFDTGV